MPKMRIGLSILISVLIAVSFACTGSKPKPLMEKHEDLDVNDRIRLAQAYVKNSRFNEAVEILDKATAKEPTHAGLRNYYGQVLLLAGREEAAVPQLLKALELDPYLTDAYNNLGVVYDRLMRRDEAEQMYKKALEDRTYPTPEKVYLNLGLLYSKQGRIDDAVASLRQAVERNPKYYKAHYELASLLDSLGQFEEAASEYEVAEPAYRGSGEYCYRIGFAYFKLGDLERAREHLERVQELAPGSTHAVKAAEVLKMME